jgi:hypothetical protein
MSLLEEIQRAAVDANSDLGTLLRKCKVLAARLGSQPLENWLPIEVLNAVRNRILDFALALQKEAPTAGESVGNATRQVEPSRVTQIFNTTVYGGSATLVGASDNSPITFNIVSNDFSSLKTALLDQGIAYEDIVELQRAVETDSPASRQGFGPKVSSWIGKMVKKAADGTWNVGVGTAGNLLAQAISKFHGL